MAEVSVRVFLVGGHVHGWRCDQADPSIRLLMDALAANADPHPHLQRARPLLRLIVPNGEGGERALVFLRSALVAVELDPPLIEELPTVHSARAAVAPATPGAAERVERPKAVVLPNFLSAADRDEIYRLLLEREGDFSASQVISGDASKSDDYDYRKSRVLRNLDPFRDPFLAAVRHAMPRIVDALGLLMPADPGWELQVTAHNHLDYFKTHRDNKNPEVRTRLVSWVWYLHAQPRPFTGGELVLFDTITGPAGDRRGEGFRSIEPADNTLVAFPSDCWHLVRTVRCPSRAFADSRFTVNGWLRDPARIGQLDPDLDGAVIPSEVG